MKRLILYIFTSVSIILLGSNLWAANLINYSLNLDKSVWQGFNRSSFVLCRIYVPGEEKRGENYSKVRINFDNDSSEISDEMAELIESSFKRHIPFMTSIELHGNADILGDRSYNQKLSQERNRAVLNELFSLPSIRRKVGMKINMKSFGEANSDEHHRRDRFVEIRYMHARIVTNNISKIYIIDGSASMRNNRTYSGARFYQIKKYWYPADSLIYVVREKSLVCSGNQLWKYKARGQTYIKEAMGVIARYLRGKANVYVFTDGIERVRGEEQNQVDRLINQSKRNGAIWSFH